MAHKEVAQPSLAAISAALPDRTTLLAFVAFVVLTGGASVAIRFTLVEMPPFWSAAARFACTAVLVWILARVRRVALPRGRALVGALLYGMLSVGFFFSFVYWGLVKTPASLSQVLVALVPLLTLFLAALHGLEPFRLRGLAGALLTVVGIVIAVGGSHAAGVPIVRVLAIIAGAACLAEAGVVAKLFPRSHPIAMNAVSMPVGALILGLASWLSGEQPVVPTLAVTWLAFGYLVAITIVTFLLYVFVLNRWTATGTSYSLVLVPLVTIVLASWLAGEQITWEFLLGGTLVVLGVWIGALLPKRA